MHGVLPEQVAILEVDPPMSIADSEPTMVAEVAVDLMKRSLPCGNKQSRKMKERTNSIQMVLGKKHRQC